MFAYDKNKDTAFCIGSMIGALLSRAKNYGWDDQVGYTQASASLQNQNLRRLAKADSQVGSQVQASRKKP